MSSHFDWDDYLSVSHAEAVARSQRGPLGTIDVFQEWAAGCAQKDSEAEWGSKHHIWHDYLEFCISQNRRSMSKHDLIKGWDSAGGERFRPTKNGRRRTCYRINLYAFRDVVFLRAA